jgi:hypothetical protein
MNHNSIHPVLKCAWGAFCLTHGQVQRRYTLGAFSSHISRGLCVVRLYGLQLLQALVNVLQLPLQNLPELIIRSSIGLLKSS